MENKQLGSMLLPCLDKQFFCSITCTNFSIQNKKFSIIFKSKIISALQPAIAYIFTAYTNLMNLSVCTSATQITATLVRLFAN